MIALALPIGVLLVALLVFVADLAAGQESRRGAGVLATVGLVLVAVASAWMPQGSAFDGAFVADGVSFFAWRVLLAAAALACLGAIDHAERTMTGRQAEYFVLTLCSLAGMMLLVGARELVLFVVAFETMSLPLHALAAMHKTAKTGVEAAIKLYVTGAVSAAVTMYGLSFVVGAAGGTTFDAIAAAEPTPMLSLGAMLALGGMAYKLGAVPFHLWVPDTYQGAPAPFVAFLATAPKVATTAALARLLTDALGGMSERWIPLLAVAGGVSMLVGTIVALAQDSVRRLLAWSGIGHVGLLLVALAANTPEAIGTLLFYGAAYALAAPGAFLLVEAVGDRLPDWRGLGRRQPFAALAMLLFLLSMGGIPFVAGFWAKMFVLWAAWQAGLEPLVFLAVLLAVAGLFYYLKVARSMYVEAPDGTAPASPARAATWVAVVLALAGVVGLGVWPGPTLEAALEAGDGLFSGVVAERR